MMSKVGRNDPCPCGSGKKYKQCCWKKRIPLGKRAFKATVLKSGPAKQLPDLMERAFGDAIEAGKLQGLPQIIAGALPKPEDMPNIDANTALQEYKKESERRKKEKETP